MLRLAWHAACLSLAYDHDGELNDAVRIVLEKDPFVDGGGIRIAARIVWLRSKASCAASS
jgi:hypothetical protein